MIKQTTLALAAALVAAASAQAEELSVTLDTTYVSAYVFRGFQLGDDSIQPSVEATYGDFYAGLWASNPISSDQGTPEVDLYAGYGFAINETFALDVGITRYVYDGSSVGDTTEAYIGLTADVLLSPSLYYYHDFDLEASSYIASIGYSVPLEAINSSLDFSGTVGYITFGGADFDYTYGTVGLALPYSLSETATLTVGGEYTLSSEETLGENLDKENGFLAKVGVSIGF